jgi:hypothetical protein
MSSFRQRLASTRRRLLGLGGLDSHLQSVESHLSVIDDRLTADETQFPGRQTWLENVQTRLADLQRTVRAQQLEIERLSDAMECLANPQRDALPYRLQMAAAQASVGPMMDWIAAITLDSEMTVSVVLPTRNRKPLLERAVASVLAQSYPNWELVIVDDGSTDDTEAFLATFVGDERFRTLRMDHGGPAAARNTALGAATGEIIVYLDDDNLMHPGWLKAVVWAFSEWPMAEVVYGAEIVDDPSRLIGQGEGGSPYVSLHPFDRSLVNEMTLADTSALAHRSGLPEARFDEALVTLADRDIFIRLTKAHDPFMLPVVACYYTTSADDRLSASSWEAEERYIQQKVSDGADRPP